MDRYSRGYDDRYRGYYDRSRSDAYRPNENYRSERDYRDPGGRGHSPSPHYPSSRSPGRDSYPKDHRYSYSESRGYPGRYSSSNSPPSRSSSRSPRRPSYGYYHPSSSYSYNSRRSPSPIGMGSRSGSMRRDSYDHRPYQGSPPYSYSSYRYPPYHSRRHYSGPPPSYPPPPPPGYRPSYHSREPSSSSIAGPPPRSSHTTPSSAAPNSPKGIVTTPSISTPTDNPIASAASSSLPSTHVTAAKSSTTTTTTVTSTHSIPSASSRYSPPPAHPYASGSSPYPPNPAPRHHNAPYHYQHSSHYSGYSSGHPSPSGPPKQRISWAPEQEKELERYHIEQGKLHDEENKILAAVRKSRFELEFASWDASKLEHQLELVQKQWEENGMEELINNELTAKLSGKPTPMATRPQLPII
ncbi:hypothetical protein CU097_013403 [Rhizopus azygosporus]|uniref:Uncharacterized protein n=1 Tax=Rhizopus azygosporus TaxID=86630 RepID=A0A367JU31_RHIAZ|nr:hypothetical protein CU097_013403 [Rhizopus azygosporus]